MLPWYSQKKNNETSVLALTEPFLLHYFERSLCDADRFILLLFDLLFSPSILKQGSCFTALFDFMPHCL